MGTRQDNSKNWLVTDNAKNWLVTTNDEFGGAFILPKIDPVGAIYVVTKVSKDQWIIQASGGSLPTGPID